MERTLISSIRSQTLKLKNLINLILKGDLFYKN